jgi:osmotically-inducible protein OsmY
MSGTRAAAGGARGRRGATLPGLRRGVPVRCAGDDRPVGRVAGEAAGAGGEPELLVEWGWWDPVVRRVPAVAVAGADPERGVLLDLDRHRFRRLPRYLPDPELELAVHATLRTSDALRYVVTRFVEIAARNGVVTASGHLATEAHRAAVIAGISGTPGVLRVEDALATDEGLVVTIARAMIDHRSLQPSRVRIVSRYGWVTLVGELDLRRDVRLAIAIAAATPGVASVESRLLARTALREATAAGRPPWRPRPVLIEPETVPRWIELPDDPHLRRGRR